jgi:hypothetical protein
MYLSSVLKPLDFCVISNRSNSRSLTSILLGIGRPFLIRITPAHDTRQSTIKFSFFSSFLLYISQCITSFFRRGNQRLYLFKSHTLWIQCLRQRSPKCSYISRNTHILAFIFLSACSLRIIRSIVFILFRGIDRICIKI